MVDKRLKYVLYILMIISLFFTIKNKVSALTINQQLTASSVQTQTGSVAKSFNTLFKNQGEGQVIYQFLVTGKRNINTLVMCVSGPNNYSSCSPCQFGTTSGYNDSSTQQVFYSLVCNVDTSNNRYVSNLILDGYAWENTWINWGSNIQFTNFKDNTDYSNVLSNVDTNLNSISSAVWSTNTYSSQIKNNLDTIISNMNTGNTQLITQIQQQQAQQHQDSQAINQSIQDTNNTLKDSSTDNQKAQDTFDSLNSNMASNSTISDLLLMPIHLLQKILNGLSGQCSAINTGQLFGEDFILPCINPSDVIGSTLWGIIDVVCSGFLAYAIGKRFVVIFNQFTNLKEGGLETAYD